MIMQSHMPEEPGRGPELSKVPDPELQSIEQFLKTPEAAHEMAELYEVLDDSGAIVKTMRRAINDTIRTDKPNMYNLFLDPQSSEGLTDVELVKLYNQNPLIAACMRRANLKHNSGDLEASQAYRDVLRISMNVVRYEWLNGLHDPLDPAWHDRASRIGEYSGSEKHLHLQPGHNRSTSVPQPRRSSPSDELPPHPSTP